MSWWLLLCTLTVWVLASSAIEERKAHRLVGGHLRIFHDDSLDSELLEAVASGSKNKKSQKGEDEEKKTLSQQVADGKYGLIQKELFAKPSKRPGVLSYDNNPEVPKDNINNLGGLTKNDIWLAENHLLVLKGGTYPPHDGKLDNSAHIWPAIDDYKAPPRQVKIPAHPKVPPPFPVQLTDDGPLQILGTNSSRTINGTLEEGAFALPPPEGFEPGGPYPPALYPYPPNATSGQAPFTVPGYPPGEYFPGPPFPPYNLNGTLPPFFASLPPGAAILPPPNLTEPIDEDDPSIYYPPPYSFYYPKDNSSAVPAGPLVPGIVLPPPPNFFGPLEEAKRQQTTRNRQRMKTTTTPLPQIRPTTTEIPPTSVLNGKTNRKPVRILPVHIPAEINNELKPIVTTPPPPRVVTVLSVRPQVTKIRPTPPRTQKTRPPTVTILKPVKPSSEPPKVYVYDNEVPNVYRTPSRSKTVVSTTQVPLKVYYSTSNDIETNSITRAPEKYHISVANTRRTKPTTKSPAQYYYYAEQPVKDATTRKPFYDIPKEYYLPAKQSNPVTSDQQQKFIYVANRPYNTQRPRYRFVQTPKTDSFSIHVARLQKQLHQYYTTTRPTYRPTYAQPKPVYQFSFEAANYRQPQRPQLEDPQDKFRPLPKYSVQIQPAIEIIPTESPVYQNTPQPNYYRVTTERPVASKYYQTQRPDYEYDDDIDEKNKKVATPQPVNQYSYEVTQNPLYHGFYTKPEEGYFDENTRHYFTTFGQKLQQSGTTPMPQIAQSATAQRPQQRPAQYQQQKPAQYQQQKPINLEGDIAVNYLPPRPTINPDAEFVPINNNQQRINYPQQVKYAQKPAQYAQETRQKTRAELVKAVPVNVPSDEGQSGAFISYQLPGDDGAHFYFLTPQLAQSRDQGAGFYYSQPRRRRSRER